MDEEIVVLPVKCYKFRAECTDDALQFLYLVAIKKDIEMPEIQLRRWESDFGYYSDCECVIRVRANLKALQSWARSGKDWHVIAETIRPIDEYTGERTYAG